MQKRQVVGLAVLVGALAGRMPLAAQTAATPTVTETLDTSQPASAWAAERAEMVRMVERDLQNLYRTDAIATGAVEYQVFGRDGLLPLDGILIHPQRRDIPIRVKVGFIRGS